MEEKSFLDFFKFICKQKVKLLIIETGLVHNQIIESLIGNDDEGFIKKKNANKPIPILNYLQKIINENEIKNKLLKSHNQNICYFYRKGKKKLYQESKIKEILRNKKFNKQVEAIQKCAESFSSSEKIITAKVLFIKNEYKTSFAIGGSKFSEPLGISFIIDAITVIIACFEAAETKRIIKMSLEFIKDLQGLIWLISCDKCVLIEANYAIAYPINSEYDIMQIIKTPPKAADKTEKNIGKANKYYMIPLKTEGNNSEKNLLERSQSKNDSNNLNFPIRVLSPIVQELKDGEKLEGLEKIMEKNEKKKDKKLKNQLKIQIFHTNASEKSCFSGLLNESPYNRPATRMNFIKEDPIELINKDDQSKRLKRQSSDGLKGHKFGRKRNLTVESQKFLPKLTPHNKKPKYGNDFMELVLKTYCKQPEIEAKYPQKEFGIWPSLSCEEFSKIITRISSSDHLDDEPQFKLNNLLVKPILEESYFSKSSTPYNRPINDKHQLPRTSKKILSLKKAVDSINKKSLKKLSLLINSPRSRNFTASLGSINNKNN